MIIQAENQKQSIPLIPIAKFQSSSHSSYHGAISEKSIDTDQHEPATTEKDQQDFNAEPIFEQETHQKTNWKRIIVLGVIIAILLTLGGYILFRFLSYQFSKQTFDLVKLNSTSAKCIDGSPPAYYLSRNGDPSKILLLMLGGAWCAEATDEQTLECFYLRSLFYYGSSNYLPETRTIIDGILNNDQRNYFRDWKKVMMHYCDASGYQGTQKQPISYKGSLLYLRGHNNTVQTFEDLQAKFGLYSKASQVVLSGESAGGIAVYTWANYLRSKVQKGSVKAISDASIFYDTYDEINPNLSNKLKYSKLMKMSNSQIDFPVPECVAQFPNEKQNCLFVKNLFPHIKVPVFHIQSVYDRWTLNQMLQLRCVINGMNTCNDSSLKLIEKNRQSVTGILKKIGERKTNGVWGTNCLIHSSILDISYLNSNSGVFFSSDSLSPGQAVAIWMQNESENNSHIAESPFQGRGFC